MRPDGPQLLELCRQLHGYLRLRNRSSVRLPLVGCGQKESDEIARTVWLQCGRLTLFRSSSRIELRLGTPFLVRPQCGHTLWRGKGFPSMKKKPRKAAQERKTLIIKIRVNGGQQKVLQAAADRASLDLSTWIRTIAIKAAKEEGTRRGHWTLSGIRRGYEIVRSFVAAELLQVARTRPKGVESSNRDRTASSISFTGFERGTDLCWNCVEFQSNLRPPQNRTPHSYGLEIYV